MPSPNMPDTLYSYQLTTNDVFNMTHVDAVGPSASSDRVATAHDEGVNQMVVILLVAVTILINVTLCVPSFINRRRRQQQWEAYRERRLRGAVNDGSNNDDANLSPEEKKRKEATRYNSIENWIVSKKIHEHDDLCTKCMSAQLKPASKAPIKHKKRNVETAATVDMTDEEWAVTPAPAEDAEDDGHECPICFEEFQMGDIASWSPESSCTHIFHHACIKEWLLKNSGCPFCRATFLPVDRLEGQVGSLKQISELLYAQEQRSQDCFYCMEHGIVTVPNVHKSRGCLTPDEMQKATSRAKEVPSKQTLVEMRGNATDCEVKSSHRTASVTTATTATSSASADSSDAESASTRNMEIDHGDAVDDDDDGTTESQSVPSSQNILQITDEPESATTDLEFNAVTATDVPPPSSSP